MNLGTYPLGCRRVNLFVTPGNGGRFNASPKSGIAEIIVGLDSGDWAMVVGVLLHEAMELAYVDMWLRFEPAPDYAKDNGSYQFVMTHTQFSEATARAACFIAGALPDLCKAYTKHTKRRR